MQAFKGPDDEEEDLEEVTKKAAEIKIKPKPVHEEKVREPL